VKSPAAPDASGVAAELERRAARAELLAGISAAAEEPLRFAAGLYRAQSRVAERLGAAHAEEPLSGRLADDAERVAAGIPAILRYAAECGPPALAEAARARQGDLPATGETRLLVYWQGGAPEDYLSRAVLRPYVELLRALLVPPDRIHRQGRCPLCGGAPWVSARRDGSVMEGAKRMLACSLCGGEWPFGRILCPSCLEENPDRLPSFSSQTHPAVRIEACETCRRYVKSLDLSEDARPIPEVDDLVSLSMDLWAREQGFERIEPGLAGL
jgi:formate dehydrogenase maturation protein FdhE